MPKDHIELLHSKTTSAIESLSDLSKSATLQELLHLIRKPGWTTPAEHALTMLALDALQYHADAIARLAPEILKAGKLVTAPR